MTDVEDASAVLDDASTEPAPPTDEPVPNNETATTEPVPQVNESTPETDASIPSEPALPADEPLPTEAPTTTTDEPDRRHQQRRRHKRRLQSQEGATTTVYDMTTPTAHGDPAVFVVTNIGEQEPKTAGTTETVVACPMELGESAGGSTLKVVAITDSHTLEETYQLMVNLPGITVRARREMCVCVFSRGGGCLCLRSVESGRRHPHTCTHTQATIAFPGTPPSAAPVPTAEPQPAQRVDGDAIETYAAADGVALLKKCALGMQSNLEN